MCYILPTCNPCQAKQGVRFSPKGSYGMRNYECVFIVRQDVSTTQVDSMTDALAAIITKSGGTIHKREYWGLRTLAYRIKKNRRGHYVLLDMEGGAEAVAEFDRQVRLNEDIIRLLITQTDNPNPAPSIVMRNKADRAAMVSPSEETANAPV